MNCKLIQNINHTCEYNPGGITEIYLLDIEDFIHYRFAGDLLFDTCFVDRVFMESGVEYTRLDTTDESAFTEQNDNGLYRQQLTTFVRSLDAAKTSGSLLASLRKYVVFFRIAQGNVYSFGSDGGASFSFTQVSGKHGEASGYNVTLAKDSVYPLFEVDAEKFNKIFVLGTESKRVVCTEDFKNAIII